MFQCYSLKSSHPLLPILIHDWGMQPLSYVTRLLWGGSPSSKSTRQGELRVDSEKCVGCAEMLHPRVIAMLFFKRLFRMGRHSARRAMGASLPVDECSCQGIY